MKTNLDFLSETLEYYPNIDVIDYSNDSILGYDMKSNKAYYLYRVRVDENISFCFHLLWEVSNSYKSWFEDAIKRNGYKIEIKETETDYYEIIYKY